MKNIDAKTLKLLVSAQIADVRFYGNRSNSQNPKAPSHYGNIRITFRDREGGVSQIQLPMSTWYTAKPEKWENGAEKAQISSQLNIRKIQDMREQRDAMQGESIYDNPNLIDDRKEQNRASDEFANRDAVHDAATARRLPATDEPDSDEVKPKRQRRKRTAA